MDRWACVDIAAFPLQLLLKTQPAWADLPAAVVAEDTPQAPVLFVNAHAHALGVRPGQRYATALALARDLRAGTVAASRIARSVRALTARLRRYSPHVEPAPDEPGLFWLDARGLHRLHPSFHAWAEAIRRDLRRAGVRAAVAVGVTRFGAYALARSHQGTTVCAGADEERARVQRVPLAVVHLEPAVLERLATLGIDTIGDFLRLPADGLRQRFGDATHALHRLATGDRWAPLLPVPEEAPQERLIHFDMAESQTDRLLFVIKRLLDSLLAALARRAHAIVELTLWMKLDDRTEQTERVRPATSTLDAAQLLSLVRLRLDALQVPAGIVTLRLTAATCPATPDQCRLFPHHGGRDPELAHQAFARLRAELGEEAVVRARLGDAHLPAAQFAWEPLDRVPLRATPRIVATRPLVRRIFATPAPLTRADLSGVRRLSGPFVLSGGWWTSRADGGDGGGSGDGGGGDGGRGGGGRGGGGDSGGIRRDYYFVLTPRGELWWLYYDRRRHRFLLQGSVE